MERISEELRLDLSILTNIVLYRPNGEAVLIKNIISKRPTVVPLPVRIVKAHNQLYYCFILLDNGQLWFLNNNRLGMIGGDLHITDFQVLKRKTMLVLDDRDTVHLFRNIERPESTIFHTGVISMAQVDGVNSSVVLNTHDGVIYYENFKRGTFIPLPISTVKQMVKFGDTTVLVTHREDVFVIMDENGQLTENFWYSHDELIIFPYETLSPGMKLIRVDRMERTRSILNRNRFSVYFHGEEISLLERAGFNRGHKSLLTGNYQDVSIISGQVFVQDVNGSIFRLISKVGQAFRSELLAVNERLSLHPIRHYTSTKSARN